jgi:hypothetical protein
MKNVKLTDVSARYDDGSTMYIFDLSWEHNGSQYRIDNIFPNVLVKRTDGVTRRLDANAACNIALIKQARSLAEEEK